MAGSLRKLHFFSFSVILAVVCLGTLTAAAASPSGPTAADVSERWTKTWGGTQNESVHQLCVDKDGNLYLTGEFGGTVDFDPGPAVTSFSAVGGQDVFLAKFSANGSLLWAKTWGGTGRDVANGLAVDDSGNVYVSGPFQATVDFNPDPALTDSHSSNAGNANNIFLSKFDANGTFLWVKTWGPSDGGAESYSIALDATNHIYVVGDFSGTTTNFNPWDPLHPDLHTNHPPASGSSFFDAYLSKFDSDGTFEWAKTWGGEGYDDGPGVAVDHSGNVYVTGMYASKTIDFDPAGGGAFFPASDSGISVDVFLSKFDANGNFKWVRTWGGQGADDAGETILIDGDNNLYVAGRSGSVNCNFNPWGTPDLHSSHGSLDAFVSKFDENGGFQWARTWGGTDWDAAGGLAVDGSNNIFVTGLFSNVVNFNSDGSGIDNQTSAGMRDIFVSMFDKNGNYRWTKTWGGSGDDLGYHLALMPSTMYVVGSFQGQVDFNPDAGVDLYQSNGQADAFITRFLIGPCAVPPASWIYY